MFNRRFNIKVKWWLRFRLKWRYVPHQNQVGKEVQHQTQMGDATTARGRFCNKHNRRFIIKLVWRFRFKLKWKYCIKPKWASRFYIKHKWEFRRKLKRMISMKHKWNSAPTARGGSTSSSS